MTSKNRMERYIAHHVIPTHRAGWPGVLDAIRAALSRKPRIIAATPVAVEFWASAPVGVRLETRINRASLVYSAGGVARRAKADVQPALSGTHVLPPEQRSVRPW